MTDSTQELDVILDNFIAEYKDTLNGRDQKTHDKAKQSLLDWHNQILKNIISQSTEQTVVSLGVRETKRVVDVPVIEDLIKET